MWTVDIVVAVEAPTTADALNDAVDAMLDALLQQEAVIGPAMLHDLQAWTVSARFDVDADDVTQAIALGIALFRQAAGIAELSLGSVKAATALQADEAMAESSPFFEHTAP